MPVRSLREIVDSAFIGGYGVPAINVVNDLTLRSVLDGAVEARSPVIVQTSVKTVRSIGTTVLYDMWSSMTAGISVPVTLHLDHCPDRRVISSCLWAGWNSVLFDASTLPVAENQRQTIEVVAEAREYGAHVEGEIESITGVEDGIGSNTVSQRQSLEVAIEFIEKTRVDVFAPSIGNAHGMYASAPELDGERVSDIVSATNTPIALHGGSGLTDEQFADLIARGCAKVNISTALKERFMKSSLKHLESAKARSIWDPPAHFLAVEQDVRDLTIDLCYKFGSAGKAQ